MLVTNSLSPVLDEAWAQPGMHINSVQRGELDRHTIDRADLIVIRSPDRDSHWIIGEREPEEVKFDLSGVRIFLPQRRKGAKFGIVVVSTTRRSLS